MGTDNLKPVQTKEEARERGRNGGIASGKARRQKKLLRECLEELLEMDQATKGGKQVSGAEAISIKLFEQALKGNIKAFETIRSTVGQDPVQKLEINEIDQETINEVEAIVDDAKASYKSPDGNTV